MEIAPDLERIFTQETEAIRKTLDSPFQLSPAHRRKILTGYAAAIGPNFIPWVAAGTISARSLEARYAASENLKEEIGGDHQGMLDRFVASAKAKPTSQDYTRVQPAVTTMRDTVRCMNGLINITLLAYLENTSRAFIPFLAEMAKSRGCKDFEYTTAHGEADVEHAKQFLWALDHERGCGYPNVEGTIITAINRGRDFLITALNLKGRPTQFP